MTVMRPQRVVRESLLLFGASLLLCLALASCGTDSMEECGSKCEQTDWPGLIVDVIPPLEGDHEDIDVASVMAYDSDGSPWPDYEPSFYQHNCPAMYPPDLLCTWGFSVGPNEDFVDIEVTDVWGQTSAARVPIVRNHYCARDLAHIRAYVQPDEPPYFSEPSYVNPCDQSAF